MKLDALIVLAMFVCIGLGCVPPRSDTQSGYTSPQSTEPPLKLLSMRDVESSQMYFRIVGEVQNVSNEKLSSIRAVITTYDSSDNLVSTEDALIEYNPLMPGQTSPYTVLIRQNPEIKSYKINFIQGFGSTVPYTNAIKPSGTPKSKKGR